MTKMEHPQIITHENVGHGCISCLAIKKISSQSQLKYTQASKSFCDHMVIPGLKLNPLAANGTFYYRLHGAATFDRREVFWADIFQDTQVVQNRKSRNFGSFLSNWANLNSFSNLFSFSITLSSWIIHSQMGWL